MKLEDLETNPAAELLKNSAAVRALSANEFDDVITSCNPTPVSTRLTTGETLVTMSLLGKQLQAAAYAFGTLPEQTPKTVAETLKNIITACNAASEKAAKLLAGSR